jgi:type IX secretion system substrate protein
MKQKFTSQKTKFSKVLAITLLCLFSMQSMHAQVCANPNNIFGITANGAIYPINATTAAVGSQINTAAYLGTSPSQSNAIGYNTVNGKFYFFKVNPTSSSGGEFDSYDPVADTYSTLSTSPVRTTVHAGCVSFNGTAYYCTDVNGNLYLYNISTNTWITITSKIVDQLGNNVSTIIQTQNSGDMAIDGLGNLWLVTSSTSNYALYKIKTPLPLTVQASVSATQIIAPTTAVPASSSGFQGIAFNASGALFLSTGNSKLYILSNATTLSLVGTLSTSGVGNDLTSCSFPFGVLAVTWGSFTASLNNNDVAIDWNISQANNIRGFYVEKSTDNKSWQALTYVAYDESEANYSAVDASPAPGNNYYRIREEDYNDQENYSSVKMVSVSSSTKISVWPNPAKDVVYVQNNGTDNDAKTEIFDQFGKMMSATVLHPGNNTVNMSNLPTGTYIMHIQEADGTMYNKKIIKKSY